MATTPVIALALFFARAIGDASINYAPPVQGGEPPVQGGAPPGQQGQQGMLFSADQANTVEELQEWRSSSLQQIQMVPPMFRKYPENNIERDYQKRFHTLTGSTPNEEVEDAPTQPIELIATPPQAEAANPLDCAGVVAPGKVGDTKVEIPLLFMTATMCPEKQDLEAWIGCQMAEVKDHVPPSHRDFAARHVYNQFKHRMDEISGKPGPHVQLSDADALPVFLAMGENCESEEELSAWKDFQQGQIDSRVPEKYRSFASGALQGAFQQRLVELRTAGRGRATTANLGVSGRLASSVEAAAPLQLIEQPSATGADDVAAAQAPPPGATGSPPAVAAATAASASSSMFLLVAAGLLVPAFLSFVAHVVRASRRRAKFAALSGGQYVAPAIGEQVQDYEELL